MLVDLGFLTLERVGGLPENSLVPLVPLPLEDVIRLLFEYIADAVIKDLVQDKDQWAEEFSKKNAGVELLRSLRNLPAFQPKKLPPDPAVKHMTVVADSSPAKGIEQIPRKS